ncbi:MAG: formylglycine-generating enzyme family protein [Pseudomonadota bacterium]
MTTPTINPALQFIHTAGISGFVNGVQTGKIPPSQALSGFNAVGAAIDTYKRTIPNDTSLAELRSIISGYPEQRQKVFALLNRHSLAVNLAVHLAATIDATGEAALAGAAVVKDLNAPFDLGAQWRWIPPGEFQMGSPDDDPYAYYGYGEKPLRTVMTGGFYMLDHPVTNVEFDAFLKAVGQEDMRNLESKFAGDYQPAVQVTHEKATAYAKWLGEKLSKEMGIPIIGRLPTEAEWEKAAKGPSGNEFIRPATIEQAHYFAIRVTRAVNHPDAYANGYGLKDMIGNVCEWTSSPWEEGSSMFVIRGGSMLGYYLPCLRAAYRCNLSSGDCFSIVSFRPVLAPALSDHERMK